MSSTDVKSLDIKTHYLQTKATNSSESATDKVLQPTPTSKILFALGLGPYGFVLGPKLMLSCPKSILLNEKTTALIRHVTFPSARNMRLLINHTSYQAHRSYNILPFGPNIIIGTLPVGV